MQKTKKGVKQTMTTTESQKTREVLSSIYNIVFCTQPFQIPKKLPCGFIKILGDIVKETWLANCDVLCAYRVRDIGPAICWFYYLGF